MKAHIESIFTAKVKLRTGGSDHNGVIAETADGRLYCLFAMSTQHGFKKIAAAFLAEKEIIDIEARLKSAIKSERAFEITRKQNRKGGTYYEAKENQYS